MRRKKSQSCAFSSSSFFSSFCPSCASSCLSSFSLIFQWVLYLGLGQVGLPVGQLALVFSGSVTFCAPFLQLIFQYQADLGVH